MKTVCVYNNLDNNKNVYVTYNTLTNELKYCVYVFIKVCRY